MKYGEMNLEELVEAYLEELELVKDNLPNPTKYKWLRRLNGDSTSIDRIKLRITKGYLIGLKDCGVNIGDLRLILDYLSVKIIKGN